MPFSHGFCLLFINYAAWKDFTLISLNMQIYSEMIGNVMTDALSTGKYYHCKCSGFAYLSILCYRWRVVIASGKKKSKNKKSNTSYTTLN
jgi:hypothetical protein